MIRPVQRLTLNGGWQFKQVDPQRNLLQQARTADGYLPARVPGIVQWDLIGHGVLPDPFYRDNEKRIQWVEDRHWLYRLAFDLPPRAAGARTARLVFDGLDTFCTLYLNGAPLGETANMFIPHHFDVTGKLQAQGNELLAAFRPPMPELMRRLPPNYPLGRRRPLGELERYGFLGRKCACSYGWDWGFRLAAIGIWKGVRLLLTDSAWIEDVHARQTDVSVSRARLRVRVSVRAPAEVKTECVLRLGGHGAAIEQRRPVQDGAVEFSLALRRPRLWWPAGYGAQPLYDLDVRLLQDGRTADTARRRVGFRRLELVRQRDAHGIGFEFRVNGARIFCRGVNFIPCDSILPRVTRADYDEHLQGILAAHMNMIRIWGGGIYECDHFYDRCDELGILVWQDFMFGNGIQPELPEFYADWQPEVEHQIRRLRGRPCLALWCGGNEIEGVMLFTQFLRRLAETHDPDTPYWAQSPSSDDCQYHFLPYQGLADRKLNDYTQGDVHAWDICANHRGAEASGKRPRFVSEWGNQSYPDFETICDFTAPGERRPNSEMITYHSRKGDRVNDSIGNMFSRLSALFPVPGTLPEFVRASQLTQGEQLAADIEHWRRLKPVTAGALIWQYNDCWPVVSWSLVDSAKRRKLSYWMVRHAFAPFLVSALIEEDNVEIWIVNDGPQAVRGKLRWGVMDFSGRRLHAAALDCCLAPDSARRAARARTGDWRLDPHRAFLYTVFTGTGTRMETAHLLKAPKDVNLPAPRIRTHLRRVAGGFTLTLQSDRVAKYVSVAAKDLRLALSDNVLDLLPDRQRIIRIRPLDEGVTLTRLRRALSVSANWPE